MRRVLLTFLALILPVQALAGQQATFTILSEDATPTSRVVSVRNRSAHAAG